MDLYFRLNVVHIQVPPLRERREDIPLLAKSFLDRLNRRHSQQKELSDALVQHLRRQDWPGNVRELENHIEKLYVLSSGRIIGPDAPGSADDRTPQPVSRPSPGRMTAVLDEAPTSADAAIKALIGLPCDEVEKRLILATLAHFGGNKSKAARQLQIGVKTLYRKLIEYGVQQPGEE
jgi:DNA-binding NtrC family response regulator